MGLKMGLFKKENKARMAVANLAEEAKEKHASHLLDLASVTADLHKAKHEWREYAPVTDDERRHLESVISETIVKETVAREAVTLSRCVAVVWDTLDSLMGLGEDTSAK